MPEDPQPLQRGVSLPRRGIAEPVFEHPKLRPQPAVLVSESDQFARCFTCCDAPLQEQQPLLTSRLGTQHHGSHDQGNGSSEDLHVGTLHKRRQRPRAPSKGPIW